ncbi:hypothetical protein ABZ215_29985 [Amycolatopsis sp. NPDC006131]|uniref:hypothetical protein n=1 Tax=Amycolatopsis sp. NPDC006131 TaxID=3156731 RepID=UPI0033A942E2
MSHVNRTRKLEDGSPDRRVWASQERLATMMRLAKRNNIGKWMRELEKIGAVSVAKVRTRHGLHNEYTLAENPPTGLQWPTHLRDLVPGDGTSPKGDVPEQGHAPVTGPTGAAPDRGVSPNGDTGSPLNEDMGRSPNGDKNHTNYNHTKEDHTNFSPLRPPLGGTRSTGRAASPTPPARGGASDPVGDSPEEGRDAYDWADELADSEANAPSVPSPTKEAEDEHEASREPSTDTVPSPAGKRAEDAEDTRSGPEWTDIPDPERWAAEAYDRVPDVYRRFQVPSAKTLAQWARRANKGSPEMQAKLRAMELVP